MVQDATTPRSATGEHARRLVTDVEFCLSVARALLPDLEKAAVFINRALAESVDQRLRSLLLPALNAIEQNDLAARLAMFE